MEIIEVQYQPVTVEVAGSGGHQAWDAYVRTCENANPYHLYAWNAIFRETFGCETCYLVAKADAKIKGVLPLFIIKNPVLGSNYISSLRGGVCADDVDAAQQLIQAAIDLTRERNARYLKLRDGVQKWNDDRLETKIEYAYVLANLPPDPDTIWQTPQARGFRRSVRKSVRKARREGLSVAWGNENLDGFYRVYATAVRDLGTPALPRRFFEKELEQFPNDIRILTVCLADQIIGGICFFTINNVLYALHGLSLQKYFSLQPNDLLYWEAIKYACEHGYRALNLGRSAPGSGHAWFKEKYMARPRELYYQYYLHKAKTVPGVRGGQLYRVVSKVWKYLPLPIANSLSPVVRRMIPMS